MFRLYYIRAGVWDGMNNKAGIGHLAARTRSGMIMVSVEPRSGARDPVVPCTACGKIMASKTFLRGGFCSTACKKYSGWKWHEIKCKNCGIIRMTHYKKRTYCSYHCSVTDQSTEPISRCQYCKRLGILPSTGRTYCTAACKVHQKESRKRSRQHPCMRCGKTCEESRKYCSKACRMDIMDLFPD